MTSPTLGSLWTQSFDTDYFTISWHEHPITKITRKCIFIRDGSSRSQIVVDRQAIERDGTWQSRGRWETYYSEAAKRREEHARTRRRAENEAYWRARSRLQEVNALGEVELLGLKVPYTASRRHDLLPPRGAEAPPRQRRRPRQVSAPRRCEGPFT